MMGGSSDERRAITLLSSIDWSFDTPLYSRTRNNFLFDCRKHHWYPATFVPEIPYSLIEVLSRPGQVVYDPFGGIGTTALQALVLGRKPYAIERCRVAVEYVRSIWNLLDPRTNIAGVREVLKELVRRYDEDEAYARELLKADGEYGALLEPWFNRETFGEVAYLILEERQQGVQGVRSAFRVALSATLKAVAAQDKGWGCIADNVLPKPEQVAKRRHALARFARNVAVLLREIEAARSRMGRDALEFLEGAEVSQHVKHGDSRKERAVTGRTVDLVVSSPPYPSMTDYATSQRLSYYLFGARPDGDFRSEIGARRRRTRSDALDAYRQDMGDALGLVVDQMREGAYACFVMPTFAVDKNNNRRRRRIVDECLTTLTDKGLSQVSQFERVLPARRRHHNQQWTSLERETIHLYRRM